MFLCLDTSNGKIVGKPRQGYAATLTLPIANTCPTTCAVKGECYAKGGPLSFFVRRLERENEGRSADSVARDAAREISDAARQGLARGRALRLFQAGDARTKAAARTLASATREWIRAGGSAWGYTHAWRTVAANAWLGVAMLASVETLSAAHLAIARGYVPARIVVEHPANGRTFSEGGVTWIPCAEQTRGIPCVRCRLCFDTDALRARNAGITFAAHGARTNALKRRLAVLA